MVVVDFYSVAFTIMMARIQMSTPRVRKTVRNAIRNKEISVTLMR